MKFLVLVLAVLPIYAAANHPKHDLHHIENVHIREKRQHPNYGQGNQAQPNIQQLLQAQNARAPLVNIPPQPVPKLGPSQPIKPQYLNQAQVSQYRPQVSISNGGQQPNYKKPILPQQPQYRPAPAQPYPQQPVRQNYNAPQQQYSSKLPPHVQKLLQYQQSLTN
ncbi:uncharacterized protein LOC116427816 [Nomia melanderi]|uniref:uncharacterized protein LOC116427816 n=1 Tax=Nomia melanderi TaxID=2448451 RepID=UPI0013046375|nr:mediator of RNA polymerase II transcription subunit 15-like [Nomia melanderi]